MTATYDAHLVALSIVIALFGSYIALDLTGQVLVAQGWARKLWLTGGTIALGLSTWAMHFIAMLAYQLPIPMVYDFTIVFVSMAVAIAGAGAGLFTITKKQSLGQLPLVAGAGFVGFSIVGLHMTAMSAMQVAAVSVYDPKLMALSTAVAIGGSGSALWLAFHSRVETLIRQSGRKMGSVILMGTAIVGMHYLGMAAVSFQGTNQIAVPPSPATNNTQLAVVVGIVTLIILILTMLASFFGQRSSARIARTEAQRQSEERFRSLVQNASDMIAIVAADYTVSYFSPSVHRILGYEPEVMLGKKVLNLLHPEDLAKAESLLSEANRCPAVNFTTEFRLKHTDGSWRDFEVIVNNLLAEPSIAGIVATCRDITERKRTEESLRLLESAVQQVNEVIIITAADLDLPGPEITFVNPAFTKLTGYATEEVIGKTPRILQGLKTDRSELDRLRQSLSQGQQYWGEATNYRKDGTEFQIEWYVEPIRNDRGEITHFVSIQRDITLRKQVELQLRQHAFHDALTGLPNRALFMDRLEQALNGVKRHKDYLFAVLFLDLDRFKVINDSLGHIFGDQLLIAIAGRLAACMRPTDTAARLGGDEFTFLIEGIKDISDALRVAERIQAELRLPFVLGEQEVFTTASIGIALGATSYNRPEDILRDADIAMYRAKLLGKARYEIFNTDMHFQAVVRLQLENALRRALERQEFQVHYQPIVSLKSGKLVGFEALVRWQHPIRGLVLPNKFLQVVQETELSIPLDHWVLETACHQMRSWQLAFPAEPPLTISVNLGSKQFAQANLVAQISSVLQETGLDAACLKLEITETVIVENADSAMAMLQLKALEIQLVIDDFGTGYSSLSRLHSFPISVLKIDRSFISHANTDLGNLEMVGTIVMLAHSLGVSVTAEGVETAEQLARLRELNCEYGQGYFFSEPLDNIAAEALITAKPQW